MFYETSQIPQKKKFLDNDSEVIPIYTGNMQVGDISQHQDRCFGPCRSPAHVQVRMIRPMRAEAW